MELSTETACRRCNKRFRPEVKYLKTSRGVRCKPCRNYVIREHRRKLEQLKKVYYVYYLPSENYCGFTNDVSRRISSHSRRGMDTKNFRVLFASEDFIETAHMEALFQSTLGMQGLNTGGMRTKNRED